LIVRSTLSPIDRDPAADAEMGGAE
jgi:hypothetical protein